MTPEERQELCALYVLGALEPEEMADLDARLQAGDPDIIHDIGMFRETVDLLPYGLSAVSPNPEVRNRLMERVRETVQEREPPSAVPASQGLLAWLRTPWVWLPAAAVAILVLSFGWLATDYQQQITRLAAEVKHLRGIATEHERLVSMLSLPNVQIVMLSGTEHATRASARLLWDKEQKAWTVITHDLAPPPPGKAYQLWFLTDGRPMPSHTFQTDIRGTGIIQTKLPSVPDRIAGAAVSLEPEGGVAQPTGNIVLVGKF